MFIICLIKPSNLNNTNITQPKYTFIKDDIILITAKQYRVVMDILFDKAKQKKTSIIVADEALNISCVPVQIIFPIKLTFVRTWKFLNTNFLN